MVKKKKKEVKVIEEAKVVVEEVKKEVKPKLISFETWWFMRSKMIPSIHAKEIIIADFKSRGLKEFEVIEDFDAALTKYGIVL